MANLSSLNSSKVAAIAKGDRSAILNLLGEVFPSWLSIDESQISVEPLTGGYSGAALFKIYQRNSDIAPVPLRVPGDKTSDPATQIFFETSDPWIPAAAQRAWSSSYRHATLLFQDDEQSPNVWITEYIAGQVGDAGLMNGEGSLIFSHVLGEAVGELHCWDNNWFEKGLGVGEREMAVRSIDSDELKKHILEWGDYSRLGKCFIDILVTELKTEGNIEEVAQICRDIFDLLEPNSLMGRLVVGHGDLKYDNTMIRSSSTYAHPELVLIDYDRVMRLPAAADLGCYLHDPEPKSKKYPPLSNRRALAEGYLSVCVASGLDVTQFSDHEVDDIVLAMETGLLIRSLWLSTIMATVFPRYRWVVPILREGIARAAKLIAQAKYDESLREKVLMRGSSSLVGKGFVLPLLLKTILKSFVF